MDLRQRVVLLVLLGAGFMLSVDFSILNIALPQAGAGVGLGPEGLPWITSAFALPAAGFALLFGRLADYFGRRRLFLAGMVLLAGASLYIYLTHYQVYPYLQEDFPLTALFTSLVVGVGYAAIVTRVTRTVRWL